MASATEDYVRNLMRPALRRQFQPIALRILAENGGTAQIAQIRQAIEARHPGIRWDRRYPLKVLEDNSVVNVTNATVSFVEKLDSDQIASLLSASTSAQSVLRGSVSRMRRGVLIRPSGTHYG